MKTPTNNGIEALADIFPWNLAADVYRVQSGDIAKRYEALAHVNSLGLVSALDTLTDREKRILLRRYRDCATYEQIGKDYGVCRERIRQIESRAIRKLRHPARRELYELVTLEEYHDLQQDYWELMAQYKQLRDKLPAEEREAAGKQDNSDLMAMPLVDLDLSVRSYNCLFRAGVKTVGDIVNMPKSKMRRIRNFGRKSMEEVFGRLRALGVDLASEENENDEA